MQPEPTGAAPAAETTAISTPAPADPTPASQSPESFDFDAIWEPAVVKANSDRPETPADPAADGKPADSPEPALTPDAAPDAGAPPVAPEAEPPAEQPLSRRQEAEQKRQAELATLRTQWESEKQSRETAEARTRELEAKQAAAVAEVASLIGYEDEYVRLRDLPEASLTTQQQVDLERWKENREVFGPVRDYLQAHAHAAAEQRVALVSQQATQAVEGLKESIGQGLVKAFASHPSIDAEKVRASADWSVIAEELVAAGAREQSEKDKAQIARLTAERDQARSGGFSSLRRAEVGGRSGGADPGGARFDPRRTPSENFDAAFGFAADVPSRARPA